MSNKKISELTTASTPDGSELVEIVQGGINKKVTTQEIANLATPGGGGTWGSITGTLSSQTDLQAALDAKQATLTAANFGDFMVALTAKTTPIDADSIVISDSAASADAKEVTLTEFKAFLKTYFDTLYPRGLPRVSATGAVVSFAIPQIYGLSGDITGNITFSTTGAVIGLEQWMIHNDSVEPSFPSEFKRMQGSRAYVTGIDNFIVMAYISSTRILYTINQEE